MNQAGSSALSRRTSGTGWEKLCYPEFKIKGERKEQQVEMPVIIMGNVTHSGCYWGLWLHFESSVWYFHLDVQLASSADRVLTGLWVSVPSLPDLPLSRAGWWHMCCSGLQTWSLPGLPSCASASPLRPRQTLHLLTSPPFLLLVTFLISVMSFLIQLTPVVSRWVFNSPLPIRLPCNNLSDSHCLKTQVGSDQCTAKSPGSPGSLRMKPRCVLMAAESLKRPDIHCLSASFPVPQHTGPKLLLKLPPQVLCPAYLLCMQISSAHTHMFFLCLVVF